MENSQIQPTSEMDNALSVECPGPDCDCPSCVYDHACEFYDRAVEASNAEMVEAVAEARNTGLWRHPSEVK